MLIFILDTLSIAKSFLTNYRQSINHDCFLPLFPPRTTGFLLTTRGWCFSPIRFRAHETIHTLLLLFPNNITLVCAREKIAAIVCKFCTLELRHKDKLSTPRSNTFQRKDLIMTMVYLAARAHLFRYLLPPATCVQLFRLPHALRNAIFITPAKPSVRDRYSAPRTLSVQAT